MHEGSSIQNIVPFPQRSSECGAEPRRKTFAGSIGDLVAALKIDGEGPGWKAARARAAAEIIEAIAPPMADFEECDDDVCMCGDYRSQHQGGNGACKFNTSCGGIGHGGADDCTQFRFSERGDTR